MSGSITIFNQPLEQKSIEQLFSDEAIRQNQDLYQQITSSLSPNISSINEKFVRDWIQYTKDLQQKVQNTQVELRRIKIVGTQTTYQLTQSDSLSLNFQSLLIRDKIYSLQEHIKQKKNDINNLDSIQIISAKLDCEDNIKQTELFLEQLKKYNLDLQNRSTISEQSFLPYSQNGSQQYSEEQTLRYNQQHQQQQQIQNTDNFTSQE